MEIEDKKIKEQLNGGFFNFKWFKKEETLYSSIEIPLHNPGKNDVEYFGPVTIGTWKEGTDKQEFEVIFDTGSANLWIPDKNCRNCDNGIKHHKYNNLTSTSYNYIGDDIIKLWYGTGSCNGYFSKEDINWGGI